MSDKMERTPGEYLTWNYPQMILNPEPGLKETMEYKDIVLRGKLPRECVCPFMMSEQDYFQEMDTPAGKVRVYFLYHRGSFERAVQILAYRGEPRLLPASMGAVTIWKINNWRKIYAHRAEYLAAGNTDWKAEFQRFTKNTDLYKDTVILLSNGYYSAISPREAGFAEEEWLQHSRGIRTWHELTHVVSRNLYPENQETIRDEVVADCIGLVAVFGTYDPRLARLFLGITEEGYRPGGRLENYIAEKHTGQEGQQELLDRAGWIIEELSEAVDGREVYQCLQKIEEGRIGIRYTHGR